MSRDGKDGVSSFQTDLIGVCKIISYHAEALDRTQEKNRRGEPTQVVYLNSKSLSLRTRRIEAGIAREQ